MKAQAKKSALKILDPFLRPTLDSKFKEDKKKLPLREIDRDLYIKIHLYYYLKLRAFPDLQNPKSFNEKIQWLKLFDQQLDAVQLTDKLVAKGIAERVLGTGFVVPIAERYAKKILPENIQSNQIYKCNHDSGSVYFGSDSSSNISKLLNRNVRKTFGAESGEWIYSYIYPEIFSEYLIPGASLSAPPIDYKIFCVNGIPQFCHLISRNSKTATEVLLDVKGKDIGVPMHPKFKYGVAPKKLTNWIDMLNVAEVMSAGYKFVRIDLFNTAQGIYFGEATFFPQSGTYYGMGQKYWGSRLNFDLDPKEPIL